MVVKTTKYSVFKGELLNQSFHDALSTSALFFAGKTSESVLRLLRTFTGFLPCPPGKNSYARHFKAKHGKLYIVGKLNKCRFRKIPSFFNSTKENCKNDHENDHASFRQTNELMGTKIQQISVQFGLNIP